MILVPPDCRAKPYNCLFIRKIPPISVRSVRIRVSPCFVAIICGRCFGKLLFAVAYFINDRPRLSV
jgi:hypothetical protein